MSKPTIWISRKLSDNTQARAARDYEVILNHDDVISSADDIVAMSATGGCNRAVSLGDL